MPHTLRFRVLPDRLAVCQLPASAPVLPWALGGEFYSVVRTLDELSIVCDESRVPADVRIERGWAALKLEGPFPFSMTGVLTSFLNPLANAGIPVFVLATFSTDYVLIKREQLETALRALRDAGHTFIPGIGNALASTHGSSAIQRLSLP